MTYQYKCNSCKERHLIEKPMSESGKEEICKCGAVLQRVYEGTTIKTSDGIKGPNH